MIVADNITPEIKAKLQDKSWRMNHLYKIKTKDQKLIQFKQNAAQRDWSNNRHILWRMILKARQLGFSTEGLIDLLDETITHKNTNSAIIAHERQKVQVLFEIVRRAYENMPQELRPKISFDNRNELYFPDLDSKIFVTLDTRGETIHNLHVSELAFVKNAEEKMAGILASVPKGGRVTFESTANGMSGYFFDEWMNEDSIMGKFFYNWMWNEEYSLETDKTLEELHDIYLPIARRYSLIEDLIEQYNPTPEQMAWYIDEAKKQKDKMRQEFPTTPLEAFISSGTNIFFYEDLTAHQTDVPITTKYAGNFKCWEEPLQGFRYVMGVDTSEGFGGDNSVICILNAHTGEQVGEYVSNTIKPDELAGIVIELGKWYNNAYAVIEYNNSGISTINTLKNKYYNLYRREQYDKTSKKMTDAVGWRTTGTTKPLLVDQLEEAVREQSIFVRSEETIKEMQTFVRTDEPGKQGYGAEGSNKDDRVIAIGLAFQGIRNLPALKPPKNSVQRNLEEYIKAQQTGEAHQRTYVNPHFNRKRGKIRGVN